MKNYKQLVSNLPSKTIVLTVEDINIPTIGSEISVKTGKKIAQMNKADHSVIVPNSKKDLLSESKKVHYLNMLYPNTNFINGQDVSDIVESLSKKYSKIIIAIEPDKSAKYKSLAENYNVQFVYINEKHNKPLTTKMKSFAAKGDYALFKENLTSNIRDIDAKLLMNDVREHLGLPPIKEQFRINVDEAREQYFAGKIFNEGELVESDGETYTIVKRGSNHLLLEDSDGNKVSKWIKDVKPIELDKKMLSEELTNKTIKPNDKIKVARMIADFLGMENAEKSSSPDALVNMALRKVKSKIIHTDSISMLEKMLRLADEVGIKYDKSALPAKMREACETCEPRVVEIDKKSKRNAAGDIMSYKDFKKSLQMNKESVDIDNLDDQEDLHIMNPDGTTTDIKHWDHRHTKVGSSLGADDNDHLRRMKVKYKTEEVEVKESVEPNFDFSEDELEKMANKIDHEDHILDLYDPEEFTVVDEDSEEEVKEDFEFDDEPLCEVLSRMERIKTKIRFMRTKSKRARRLKIVLKKRSDSKTINRRARKLAIKTLKERLTHKKVSQLSIAEKERIEKMIQQRKALVNRLAMRMVPRIRRIEQDRLTHKSVTKD